jgi:hypothetical protein
MKPWLALLSILTAAALGTVGCDDDTPEIVVSFCEYQSCTESEYIDVDACITETKNILDMYGPCRDQLIAVMECQYSGYTCKLVNEIQNCNKIEDDDAKFNECMEKIEGLPKKDRTCEVESLEMSLCVVKHPELEDKFED